MFLLHRATSSDHLRRNAFARRACLLVAALACSLILLRPSTASAQTVVQHDFEDGTLQGWTPRGGGVILTNTTEAATYTITLTLTDSAGSSTNSSVTVRVPR